MPEAPLSQTTVYSPRPVIRVDGRQHDRVTDLLLSLTIRQQDEGLASAELRFADIASDPDGGAGWAFQDAAILDLGVELDIRLGDTQDPQHVFTGRVTALELELGETTPPELVVHAEDALQRARMKRRTRTWSSTTIRDLCQEIAQSAGLRSDVRGLDDDLATQVQLDESDLAFLRRQLSRLDGTLDVTNGALVVRARPDRSLPEVVLIRSSQLRSIRFMADLAHQATTVSTAGFSIADGEAVQHTASDRRPGPGRGKTGSEFLSDTLGDRPEHIAHLAVGSRDEARRLAETAFDHRARRFVTADGTAAGNPMIRLGTRLTLEGCGPRFDNTYEVVAVTHRLDLESGYQTDFRAECAFFGEGR